MKVKYIINEISVTGPKFGKVYDVISIECDWYRLIDESGYDSMFPPEAFEIVEPLPMPPILTEEDIENGLGGKYMVHDEYGDYLKSIGLSRDDDWEVIEKRIAEVQAGYRGGSAEFDGAACAKNKKRELTFA